MMRPGVTRMQKLSIPRVLAISLLVFVVLTAVVDEVVFHDRIFPGVSLGPVRLGWLTRGEAVAKVSRALDRTRPVRLTSGGKAYRLNVQGSSFGIDPETEVNEAFSVGRTHALPARLATRAKAITSGVRLLPTLDVRPPLRARLSSVAHASDVSPVNAHFVYRKGKLRIVPSRPGARLNEDRTAMRLAEASLSNRTTVPSAVDTINPPATTVQATSLLHQANSWISKPVRLVCRSRTFVLQRSQLANALAIADGKLTIDPKELDGPLLPMRRLLRRAPIDARFVVVRGTPRIRGSSPGREIDPAGTAARLAAALVCGQRVVPTALRVIPPQRSTADLANLGIRTQLSTFTTRFRLGKDRRDVNISLASRSFQGTVLAPGQVFSLNRATGARNRSTGYRESLGFVGGKVVPAIGGGTCQVSSTLYDAALLAGLRIVDRSNHSMAVSYIPPGRDATTFYPSIDLKFQNNRSQAILLWSQMRGDRLTVQVYGSGGRPRVRITTVLRKTLPPKSRIISDPRLRPGVRVVDVVGRPGYIVSSYRTIWKGTGVVQRELLATDRYRPKNWVIRVGE